MTLKSLISWTIFNSCGLPSSTYFPHTFLTHNACEIRSDLISGRLLHLFVNLSSIKAPDSFPTHLIKVTIAEPALLTFAFSSSVWMGLLFSFLSANQPVLFGNVCIPPIKQGGAWWLLIRSSVGPEQHSWGCAGSLLERNAAENKSRETDSPNPKKQYFFFF